MATITYTPTQYQIPAFTSHTVNAMEPALGSVEYSPNQSFVFPMQSSPSNAVPSTLPLRRPVSMQIDSSPSPRRTGPQRKSVSALPTFSFNATDTSGLDSLGASAQSTGEPSPTTPSKAMRHRRGASEFVGGNSQFGVPGLVSTSPTKTQWTESDVATTGSPAKKPGHSHRRSAAISGHDLPSILQSRDTPPPTSQLSTEAYEAAHARKTSAISFAPSIGRESISEQGDADGAFTSPRSMSSSFAMRPRVGFVENVEIIPRPLSTISSATESSTSTPISHSKANSISSMLNLPPPSPSPSRRVQSSLVPTCEESSSRRSSLEVRKSIEHEGLWLNGQRTSTDLSDLVTPQKPTSNLRVPEPHIDFRRRSEPSISLAVPERARASSISLQEPAEYNNLQTVRTEVLQQQSGLERKSSVKRVKAWASAMLHRKEKRPDRAKSMDLSSLANTHTGSWAEQASFGTPSPSPEPDLEELFSHDPFNEPEDSANADLGKSRIDMRDLDFQPSFPSAGGPDDSSPVLDLDAMLGSPSSDSRAASFGNAGRRPLHSSRLNRDFAGPGMHYHRRAESAPALAICDFGGRSSSPNHSPMADVFEEEEEEETLRQQDDAEQDDELSIGIQVVDMEGEQEETPASSWEPEDDLGIQKGYGMGRIPAPYSLATSHLSTPSMGRRPSSIVEETIMEESSPIEIVEDYEEPRASSLTKSSDSSETPTILADQSAIIISLPQPQPSLMTPTTYAASTFSSPDLARRQGSFDTSRLGTSASSMTDARTMSSFTVGDAAPDLRMSVDEVPSLTSSRSTMLSTMHQGGSRRDFSDRSASTASGPPPSEASERRRKRSSIQSLSKLVGAPFGENRSRISVSPRPQTALLGSASPPKEMKKKKEHRLSKLMFWKHKQSSPSIIAPK